MYRAYSFQVKTPRSKKRTSHEGMQYHLEFERESGDKKDGQHKVSRQHVKIEFNRTVEYMDNEGTGLTDQVTRRIDPVTKKEMGGVSCDAGQTTSKAHPGKNCVLQDFYLDRFKKMVYSDDGNRKLFSMQSDLQGTSPWCTDPSAACAQKVRSSLKPSVAFDIGFGQAAGSGVDFAHAKMNVTISNFPYKFKNSTLALRSKVFALSMTSDLSKEDQKFKAGQLDSMIVTSNHCHQDARISRWTEMLSCRGTSSCRMRAMRRSTSRSFPRCRQRRHPRVTARIAMARAYLCKTRTSHLNTKGCRC